MSRLLKFVRSIEMKLPTNSVNRELINTIIYPKLYVNRNMKILIDALQYDLLIERRYEKYI